MASLIPRVHSRTLSWLNKQIYMAGTSLHHHQSSTSNSSSCKKAGHDHVNDHRHCAGNNNGFSDVSSSSSSSVYTSDNESEFNNNETQCTICLGKWRKPVQVPCQYPAISPHIFCKSCLEKWFKCNRSCPTCRHPVPDDFTPTILNNEQLNRLLDANYNSIPCPNRDKGCKFLASDLDSIDLHESQCQFQTVTCPFAGCSLVVDRRQLNSHVESCIFAKATYWSGWLPTNHVDPPPNSNNNNNNNSPANKNNPLKRKWLSEAESHVADLIILPNNTTAVVCFHGQILNLANNPSSSAVVLWRSRVRVPRRVVYGRTQVCHATYDYITNRIYFSVCPFEEGIFWADLSAIEQVASPIRNSNNDDSIELKPLVIHHDRRQFWGLTAIPQLQVIACCHRQPNTIGFWSARLQDGNMASGCLVSEISFNVDLVSSSRPFLPFRCATYVSMTSPGATKDNQVWHVTLAVDDIKNSRLHLLGLVAHEQDHLENNRKNNLQFEQKFEQILAWQGVQKGAVNSPDGLHFDPEGKLIVADSGNYRLQIFAATGGIQTEPSPPRSLTTRRRSNSDLDQWRCVWSSSKSNKALGRYDPDAPNWCSMKMNAVVAPLDPKTHRPFILAGLWDDEDVICFR